jgi:hypothetical protein
MKRLLTIVTIVFLTLSACKKNTYKNFEGTYDIQSNGTVGLFTLDTTFVNEPGMVIIRKGEEKDEIFMYIETQLVTGIAPLGVYATAKIEGNTYEMEARNVSINLIDGFPLSINIDAKGTLSEDNKTLTSEVSFSGAVNGTMTSIGIKRE